VGPCVVVRGGVDDAHDGSRLIHVRADGRECSGEVVEGLEESGARVANGEGDKLYPSLIFLEGRN